MSENEQPSESLTAPPEGFAYSRDSEDLLRAENEHLRETLIAIEEARDVLLDCHDNAPVGMITLSPHGVIQKANLEATALLNREGVKLVGNVLQMFLRRQDRPLLTRHLLSCRQNEGAVCKQELELARTRVPIQLLSRYVIGATEPTINTVVLDIRDQVNDAVEKQRLIDAELRARRTIDSKDQFIAMLSHELRTPLTPILVSASALKDDPNVEVRLREVFARIARNAAAEARLVDDLLDATGLARGKVQLVSVPTNLHDLVAECAEGMRADALRKQQQLEVELGATAHWVAGDPLRLRQIFTNLLRNSIKFTPNGGRIHVRSWNGDTTVSLEVEDSGIGFQPEFSQRMFKPFDQLDRPENTTGGLGLGLAISKGLVELHNGKISAASRGPNTGARFVVELPTVIAPRAALKSEPFHRPPSQPPGAQRLLLVEDHEDTAELLGELLELSGYSVVVANSVASALEKDNPEIDLIVSDLGLPDGTGTELIEKLQQKRRRPAIALSGFGTESDVRTAKSAGFDLHLTKPVAVKRLLDALESLTTGR